MFYLSFSAIKQTVYTSRQWCCHRTRPFVMVLFVAMNVFNISCSTLMSSASEEMAANLANAIRNQEDPETVRLGAPAYLIMIDGMIEGAPENANLLATGANLYSSYAGIFINDAQRRRRMADKAWQYAIRSMCQRFDDHCGVHKQPFEQFEKFLTGITDEEDASLLYTYGTSWAGYIQANAGDFNAVANIPKVTATLNRVQKLDDLHDNGGVHVYLGVLGSLIPPSLGGKPDEAKTHFERAIDITGGKNLMVKVLFAEKYARLVFDRALHDEILQNVLNSEPRQPGMTLMNLLAQDKAKALLDSADEYF
jgi:hypothetical protein